MNELDSTKVIPQRTIVLLENTSTTKINEYDDHYSVTIKSQSEDITISAGAHVFCAGYDPETDTRITDKSVTYIGQQSGKYGTIGSTLKDVEPIIIEACDALDESPPAGNNKAFDWINQTFNGSSNIQNGTQAARMLSNIGAKFNEKSDIMAALYTDNQPKKTKFDAADYCNKNAITGTEGKITLHSLDVNQTVVCSAINEASVYKVAAKLFAEKNWPFPLDASCGEDKSCGTCGAFEVDKDRRKTDSKVVNDGDTMTCDIESIDAAEKGKVYLIGKPPKQEEN